MKHLLNLIIVAIIVGPVIAARDPSPVRGARRMLLFLLAFDLLYVAFLTLVHAPFSAPQQ
jgi:hypothetical protein